MNIVLFLIRQTVSQQLLIFYAYPLASWEKTMRPRISSSTVGPSEKFPEIDELSVLIIDIVNDRSIVLRISFFVADLKPGEVW